MKNFEKIVPVLASGLVVAGLGTADAFATETPDTQTPVPTPPAETQQSEADNQSMEIKNVTPIDTEQKETGGTTTEGVVNFDVDSNGDGTSDGILEVETTPPVETDSKTETSTTTNPDGSTTTTTNTTTTTESTTDITGTVNGGKGTPSSEEQGKVETDLSNSKDQTGNYDWNTFKNKVQETYGKDAKVDVVDNNNGSHTVTIEQSTPKPLTQSELSAILGGVELKQNSNGDYTYTKDGAEVTVKVREDNSKETTTTTWTVTVTETTKPSEDQVVTPGTDITISDKETDQSKLIKDILDRVQKNELTSTTKDNVTTIVDGNKTYELTYTAKEPTKVNISTLSDAELNALLPADGKYENMDGVIFQTIGDVVRELTFDSAKQTLTVTEYTISLKVKEKSESDTLTYTYTDAEGNPVSNEQAVKDSVTIKSVVDAVMQAITTDKLNYDAAYVEKVAQSSEDGTWTVTVGVGEGADRKTYTYTVKSTISDGAGSFDIERVPEEHKGNVVDGSGSTTTITGNAYVSGETVVWTDTKAGESVIFTDKGEVDTANSGLFAGERVTSSKYDKETNTTTVVTQKDGVTKTYIFKHNQPLDDTDKAALQAALSSDKEISDFNGLTKTTWTVTETVTNEVEIKDEDVPQAQLPTPTGVTKNEANDTYSYGDVTLEKDNKLSTSDKKVYTGTASDGTIYTIEETKVPLANLTADKLPDDAILGLIAQKGHKIPVGVTPTIDREKGTVTYKDGNQTVTIDISQLTQTEIKLSATIKEQFESTVNKDDVKKQIATWIEAQLKAHNNSIKIGDYEITGETKDHEIEVIVGKLADQITNKGVDFSAVQGDDLVNLLNSLKDQSNGKHPNDGYWVEPSGNNATYRVLSSYSTFKKGQIQYVDGVYYKIDGNETKDGLTNVFWQKCDKKGTILDYQNKYYWNYTGNYVELPLPGQYQSGYNEKLGHLDLVSDNDLTLPDGTTPGCVITTDVKVLLGQSADDIKNGTGDEITFCTWINRDNGQTFYQYKRLPGTNIVTGKENVWQVENYLDRTNQFYKVTGTVAYGDYISMSRTDGTIPDNAAARQFIADSNGKYKAYVLISEELEINGKKQKIETYRFYTETAQLITYGYLGPENNACENQYDINLGNLQLIEGKNIVTSVNDQVTIYSTTATATYVVDTAVQNMLAGGNIVTETTTNSKDSEITGSYEITETKNVYKGENEESGYKYEGQGTGSYDSYKVWQTDTKNYENAATGTQYGGSLSYTYEVPGTPEVTVEGTTQTNRVVDVTLDNTSVTVTPGTPVTTPGDNGGGGGGDNRTPTTPTPPVDIPEEEPPLVDIPEEEPPLVDVPEEEPPLVDVPEEEPPLVDIPDTQPPKVTIPAQKVPLAKAPTPNTVEILEEDVPLAEVPETGESPMGLLAAAAACFSALGLGLLKKRED